MSRKARLGVLGGVLALVLFPGSAGAANFTSTFNTGTEGWRDVGNHPTEGLSPGTHVPSGGNPGGFIRFADAIQDFPGSQGGGVASPASWGGNRTANFGGTLAFDLRPAAPATDRQPFVVFVDDEFNSLQRTFATTPAPNQWTTFTVPLTGAGGWVYQPVASNETFPATPAHFQDVFADMTFVSLLGDLKTGADTTDFDNVSFLEPGVPVPGGSDVKRTVSISYKANRFKGRVKPNGPCATKELVRVYRVKKGKDPMVGKDLTNGKGRYVVPEPNADGRYYAKVKKSTAGADTCLAAQSKKLNVG